VPLLKKVLKYADHYPDQRGVALSESVRAVERALDVLMCFSQQTPELSMTEIAEQIGIHKSTVHRLLATLENNRFVQRDPVTGTYRLGIRLLQMAYLTLEQNDLRRLAAPFMRELNERYQENLHLAILDEADIVFVSILESPQRVKLAAAVGQRLPTFATASGKVMLAFLPTTTARRILGSGMPRFTQNTPGSAEAYIENLPQIRMEGFALSEREYEEEINAVAAPIFGPDNQPFASLAVAGPAYRLSREQMLKIGPELAEVCKKISQELALFPSPKGA
jgi:IclR family transcriptional regulator, KDG regulon repressor